MTQCAPATRPCVVFLDHVARMSGAEIALLRLCEALGETGELTLRAVLGEEGPLASALGKAGVAVEVMELGRATGDLRRSQVAGVGLRPRVVRDVAAYTWQLAERLRNWQPILVHSFSLKANLYGAVAARLARVPHIWQANDRLSSDYLPGPAVGPLRLMARTASTTVVANSRTTLETVCADGWVRYPPLPRGWPDAAPRANPAATDPLVVAMVGRLAPWKGQDLFLRAFASAFAGGSERAVLIGSALFGEDAWEARLRDLCTELGIRDQVDMAGQVDDVPDRLSGVSVLAHCSRIPEPFGQVVAEGMAVGLPVVAAAAGGPLEMIENGRTGLLVEPGDVAGLSAALRQLADDPQLRGQLGGAARLAAARFDPRLSARDHIQIYRAVQQQMDDSKRRKRGRIGARERP